MVEDQLACRSAAVDPLRLKLELEAAQRTLAARAGRPASAHSLRSEGYEAATAAQGAQVRAALELSPPR